ncbi:hypothetical protein DPMN_057786 [Dreissena polymorpha]|uniref:Uncharacterized protein n=1 Tax=Dreissena polymorpha TaxID=45954 RepID=A0A9D4C0T3_DREPO|nr:hypothetical protein DPMN_057786 [Dreissena polymorpha]
MFIHEQFIARLHCRKFQYFRFGSDEPGIVFLRERRDFEEISVKLINNNAVGFAHNERPSVLSPAGLSESRRSYLTKSVIQYISESKRNVFISNSEWYI